MRGSRQSVRADIEIGVVCGLGAAAATWTIAASPRLLDPECLAFVTLSAPLALARPQLPLVGPLAPGRAVVLAALVLFGLGPSVVAAEIVALVAHLARRGATSILRTLHVLASAGVEALVPGLVYVALDRVAEVGAGAVVGYVVVAVATHRALRSAGRPAVVRRPPDGLARAWLRSMAAGALHAAGGLLAAAAFVAPAGRALLPVAPLLALFAYLRRARAEADAEAAPGASRSAVRAITTALAEASVRRGSDEQHLERVRDLVVRIGERLGLARDQLEALAAAALLHEVGCIGVVDVVRGAGPGAARVEPHPALGAEIVDAVSFPFPVHGIVLHQHERWDGSGRPAGLAAERIPIGARILAVADAFDRATSGPGPRRALDESAAVDRLREEAGSRFEPRVVEALADEIADGVRLESAAPVAGSTTAHAEPAGTPSLGLAARELHTLYEIERSVGYRLDVGENLLLILGKLGDLVPYDTAAVFAVDEPAGVLRASYAFGAAASEVRGLELPLGERLSGRVALEGRAAISTGGPDWDLARRLPGTTLGGLGSALATPLVVGERTIGVLTLYAAPERRFASHDRRVVVTVAAHAAQALARGEPGDPGYLESLTDPETGLPNARYLEISVRDLFALATAGGPTFGLLAFRVADYEPACERHGLAAATRLLGVVGRRIAAGCAAREVPVRFGTDLFLVLVPGVEPRELVPRWDTLLRTARGETVAFAPGGAWRPRVASAHAACPADGRSLATLLDALGARLGAATDEAASIIPFRAVRSAG